jgi:hypothetical protein
MPKRKARSDPPATPPRQPSSRKRQAPPRSPDSQLAKKLGVFKDSPQKLAFFTKYSNLVYSGEIGPGKTSSKKKTEEIAKEFNVRNPRHYFNQLKTRVEQTGRLNRKKRKGNMILEMDTPESERMRQALVDYAVAQHFKFTYKMAEDHMRGCGFNRGCSAKSIQTFITKPENKWKQMYEGTIPLLTRKHKRARFAYAKAKLRLGDGRWLRHIDVDGKWFFAWNYGQKCKVPPGYKRPKKILQSKSHIPKIMFLAVTAMPQPDKGFDGKIGFFRVCEIKTAKKNSRYHKKGDEYEVDVPLDANRYRQIMEEKVFPASRHKMPWATALELQQDGATPHTGKKNVAYLNRIGAIQSRRSIPRITVSTQPAQSPDTNINDLAIFSSMSKRVNTKQKFEEINDLDRLAANARKVWHEFPTDVLTKAWATKTEVLKAIVMADGGNDFTLPHSDELVDFDWEVICNQWENSDSEEGDEEE